MGPCLTGANEKYMGDAILQKTFTLDLFSRQQVKNEGQLPKYYVENAHVPIIDRATFRKVQEELARRSSLRKTSSKAKTEQGKHSGKYVLSGLVVCSECGSPYRRITYMPDGQKRFVWRCLNRIEHGKRICKHSTTVDELELQAAVTAALNEMFRQREARETLADCVATALAGTGDNTSLPAVEAKLRALQEEQMNLFRLAANAGPENTEYDDRMIQVNAAMMELTARKTELEREDGAARYVEVTAGLTGNGVTEILTGLTAGQQLVTVGQAYLNDGDPVRIVSGTETPEVPEETEADAPEDGEGQGE